MLSPSRKLYHFSLFLLVRPRARISLFLLLNPERGFFLFHSLSLQTTSSSRSANLGLHRFTPRSSIAFVSDLLAFFCLAVISASALSSLSPVLFFLTTFAPSYSLALTLSLLVYSCNRYTFFLFLPRFTDWLLSISVFLALILRSNFALRNNSRGRIIACSKYDIAHFIPIASAKT